MLEILLENLIPVLVTIITPILLLFAKKAVNVLAKKLDFDQALVYDQKVEELVSKGIKAVEKKSLSAIKHTGDKTPGQKKLEDVLRFVNDSLSSLNLPEKAAHQLEMLIEAQLFDTSEDNKPGLEGSE